MNKMQYNSDSGLLVKNQQRRGDALKNANTKAEKKSILLKIKHAVLKQRPSENHANTGQH